MQFDKLELVVSLRQTESLSDIKSANCGATLNFFILEFGYALFYSATLEYVGTTKGVTNKRGAL
jgi:hypothetical protein